MRRQSILDAAAGMLDEMSVSDVSLNELSRRVGLAKSNVLRYFESREAILLELLDRTWKRWTAGLPEALSAAVTPEESPARRAEQFATAVTGSLAPYRVLCDLLSAYAGVLEHNVSPEVAARYKRAAVANVEELADLARAHLPELGERATRLAASVIMMIGAVWTHARPSPSMLAAYAADPSLALWKMDFATALREELTTVTMGALARASASRGSGGA